MSCNNSQHYLNWSRLGSSSIIQRITPPLHCDEGVIESRYWIIEGEIPCIMHKVGCEERWMFDTGCDIVLVSKIPEQRISVME